MHSLRAISSTLSTLFCKFMLMTKPVQVSFMYTAAFQIFTKGCLTDTSNSTYLNRIHLLQAPTPFPKSNLISIFSISRNQTIISCLSKYLEIWEESFTPFFPLYRHIQLIAKPCQCCILISLKFTHFSLLPLCRSGASKVFFYKEPESNYLGLCGLYNQCHNYSSVLL